MGLDIRRELSAVNLRNYDFYDKLTDEEKKKFSPYVLMRWVTGVKGTRELQEWYIDHVNEKVNKDHWVLSKDDKPLLWKLYASCGIGSPVQHEYIKAGSREKPVKIEKLLCDLYPGMKMTDVKLMASMMTKQDRTELFDSLGFDKKQRKEYE